MNSCDVCDETKTENNGNEATHENRQIISCILIKTILLNSSKNNVSFTVLNFDTWFYSAKPWNCIPWALSLSY